MSEQVFTFGKYTMEKDFTFYPSTSSGLKCLKTEEVETYNRDGYLKGIRIFDADQVLANRKYFDRLLEYALAQGKSSYSISGSHVVYGGVYDLMTSPQILDLAEDLLGSNVVGIGAHYFCKLPHDPKVVSWHQDFTYWPLDKAKVITVWLAIDDVDQDNACIQVVPGAHHHGLLPYRESDPQEKNVLNQTVDNVHQYGTPDCLELKAGEVSIHSCLLLHGSSANDSDRRRCGIGIRYAAVDVHADESLQAKGVLCRGTDLDGNWADPPRPAFDP
jgi:non-heme Fe2+,alpha-ketoglutarate-dependent halogenase